MIRKDFGNLGGNANQHALVQRGAQTGLPDFMQRGDRARELPGTPFDRRINDRRLPIPAQRSVVHIRGGFGPNDLIIHNASGDLPGIPPQNRSGADDSSRSPGEMASPTDGGGIQHPGATEVPRIDLEKIGLDRDSLANFTTQMRGLLSAHVLPLLGNRRDIDALSVGCGMMLEADAYLHEFTGGKYFGLDITDHRNIARMAGAITEADESAGRVNFSLEDGATKAPDNPDAFMNRPWKLIFGRNIEFAGSEVDKTTAAGILDNSIDALDSEGVLLLTNFNEVDSRLGEESLRIYEQQGKIRIIESGSIQNPDPAHRVPMQDSYFTVAVKI